MREIKFRAWEKNLKEIIPVHSIDFDNKIINSLSAWRFFHEIELMQYTGLKDRNGKEIYEGDILECHHKTKGNVFFHDDSFRLSSDQCELNLEDIHSYDDLNQYLIEDNDLVVIGNIYENPELLEVAG
jgi:uncharacterized phage protein (TIGR01671 family)